MDQQKAKEPAQLLVWLDERHREDRQQLVGLRKLAEEQGRELENLTKRFDDLERRLAGTQARLSKFSEIEEALEGLRSELVGLLEESESRLRKTNVQLESRLDGQAPKLISLAKALEEAQGALTKLESRVETMPARIDSQMEQAAGLARDIEELEKRFNHTQARLAELNERLSNQTDATAGLARQVEGLEGRLSSTQAQLVKFPRIEAALRETKNEIVGLIDELEEDRKKEAKESAELHESEHKDIRATLDNIEKRLEWIPQLDERIKTLTAEDKRLADLISEHEQGMLPLRKTIEEHRERISYLEEGRPRISHRIDELETRVLSLDEAIRKNEDEIQFLQGWAQRSAEKIDELKRFEDQMEQWRAAFVEEIRQGEQRRDRRLNDWEKVLDEHVETIDRWRETLRRYEVSHQDNRRTMSEIQALAERLARDQAEVAEKQRLADERLQRQFEAWQEENEKRWRLFLKRRDYDWEQQAKQDARQDRRLESLEEWRDVHTDRFAEELDRLDENDRRVLTRIVGLIRRLDEGLKRQVAQQKEQRETLREEMQSSDMLVGRSPVERRPGAAQRPADVGSKE